MKQPIHLIGEYQFVEVPIDATRFEIRNYGLNDVLEYEHSFQDNRRLKYLCEVLDLPEGNWQFICTSKECSEEQAAGIVEQQTCGGKYKDYEMTGSFTKYGTYTQQFARYSLQSLLKSKGCNNNNYAILKKQ